MAHTIIILFDGSYSFYSVAGFGIAGFAAGFLVRLAVNAKQKRAIQKLENQMLNNHSRILNLETTIGNLESKNAELLKLNNRKAGLKAS